VHSTRFHNVSTTGVDSGGLTGTGVEKEGPSFQSSFELLAEKNERHRLVRKCLRFEFESLRIRRGSNRSSAGRVSTGAWPTRRS
jgi:hypothetical protein